jgi:site-specific DNA recombinase
MTRPATNSTRRKGTVRCAIYARKSSEEGLEQQFNSLQAQREACEAFITSQRHEGWVCLRTGYDDGGFSGATMGRPALQRLLAGIAAGRVDIVVVYKIDRLTRSLADFAKIVEILDARSASFVSVTQQFNTTTSMGRLTLNVLLSFAQFEREVIGERIRDKIAASKKKGMWMGGVPPLGYRVQDRKLVIIDSEAEIVRSIFRRYAELGSVRLLKAELEAQGSKSKLWTSAAGRLIGGKPFSRGALYLMLRNRTYRGEIVHQEQSYPSEHPPIIDQPLWDAVQRRLAGNTAERNAGTRAHQPSLLAGLLATSAAGIRSPVDRFGLRRSQARSAARRHAAAVSARTGSEDGLTPCRLASAANGTPSHSRSAALNRRAVISSLTSRASALAVANGLVPSIDATSRGAPKPSSTAVSRAI